MQLSTICDKRDRFFVLPTSKWFIMYSVEEYRTTDDTLEVLNIAFCLDIRFLDIKSLVQLRSSLN